MTSTTQAMIDLRAVQFSYPGFTLGPQTWSVGGGGRCALVGPNGAGKTTLLSLLAGQLQPSAGDLSIAGVSVVRDPIEVRARVALVPDRLLCCPWMNAAQHFRLQARFFANWNMPLATEVARALELPMNKKLGTLSRGTSLKVALCCSLAQQASVLLLDEPTAGLDPVARADFLQLLRAELARRPETTVVFATHILEDLDELETTSLVLIGGGVANVVDLSTAPQGISVSAVARQSLLQLNGRDHNSSSLHQPSL